MYISYVQKFARVIVVCGIVINLQNIQNKQDIELLQYYKDFTYSIMDHP